MQGSLGTTVDENEDNENSDSENNNNNVGSETPALDISAIYNNVHSILHFVDRTNPTGGYPANPANDSQYRNWEYGVQQWNKNTFGALLEATQAAQALQEAAASSEDEEVEDTPRDRNRRNNDEEDEN